MPLAQGDAELEAVTMTGLLSHTAISVALAGKEKRNEVESGSYHDKSALIKLIAQFVTRPRNHQH